MIPDFLCGVRSLLEGTGYFFRSKKLWKYSLIPLLLVLVCYTLLAMGVFRLKTFLESPIRNFLMELPQWCRGFLEGGYNILSFLLLLLFLLLFFTILLPPLYEFFHSIFSDAILEAWEKENGTKKAGGLSFRQAFRFFLQNLFFSIKTILIFPFFLPIALLLPLFGPVIPWSFLAYRLGLSLILPAGFYHGEDAGSTLALARQKKAMVMGLGTAASLSLLIPFLFPLFLPGMTIGGAMVYKELNGDPPADAE